MKMITIIPDFGMAPYAWIKHNRALEHAPRRCDSEEAGQVESGTANAGFMKAGGGGLGVLVLRSNSGYGYMPRLLGNLKRAGTARCTPWRWL